MDLYKILESSVIESLVFSIFGNNGPQPIYMFPKEASDKEADELSNENTFRLTLRDYLQISVKNLSLLMGYQDKGESEEDITKKQYFCVIPFPDFNLTALTYYHLMKSNAPNSITPTAFSILVKESKRSFLYNNMERFKPLIITLFQNIDGKIITSDDFKPQEEIEPLFQDFLTRIVEIEKKPYAPLTSRRKMKVLFSGLDDSGKTSFLLSIDHRYSKLLGLKPTLGVDVKSIEALGASFFIWDLGGQVGSRERYINKAHIYLYETDLIYYFIDIRNKERFEESIEYLQNILIQLDHFHQHPPIIFVFSKGDNDILNSEAIKDNINFLINKLSKILDNKKPDFYITSIFSIFSILRAFSSGISKLSPNRELINFNLKRFSKRADVALSLFLNNDGLVLADYYSKKLYSLMEVSNPKNLIESNDLRNIFEVSAPQLAMLYKIFSNFKTRHQDEASFKIDDKSLLILKRIQISDFNMFVLFLIDNEKKKAKINQLLPDFLYRISDLLLRYIS